MKSLATPTIAQPVPKNAPSGRALSLDNRFLPPLLITSILLAAQFSFGILESARNTLIAIVTAMLTELVLARTLTGKWPHLASSYITGISVGILIRSPATWPFVLCSVISITSKYALRVKERHLWNPSNFGICALLFLAPYAVASLSIQWGNYLWPMYVIWLLGAAIIWRLRRLHITATYVASFLLLGLVRSWITGHPFWAEVAPITGPMYQLFIFFMITDPKTTVRNRGGQIVVAFLVAAVEMFLRLAQVIHAPYYALFIVGPVANILEIWSSPRQSSVATS